VELAHSASEFGGWRLSVGGTPMARGHNRPLLGWQATADGPLRWLDVAKSASVTAAKRGDTLTVRATLHDEEGADWEISQRFRPGRLAGAIEVETDVQVTRDRYAVFLPLLLALPGADAFGSYKKQALFAGLEYLDGKEPSSSEADVVGPEAKRQVPYAVKITLPVMAIVAQDRYVALAWEKQPQVAALFYSPDRTLNGGGHVMGLLFPGANGVTQRAEGSLLPYAGAMLPSGKALHLRAVLLGGRGTSVAPAIQQYVAWSGGPPSPPRARSEDDYRRLAFAGWRGSGVRVDDGHFRHAYPGDFGPQPAADAAVLLEWLGKKDLAQKALAAVPPADLAFAGVGHVHTLAPLLVFAKSADEVIAALARIRTEAHGRLSKFAPDGTVPYKAAAGKPDYGRTHFAQHANGMTGEALATVLEAAAVTGDPELQSEGLRLLRLADRAYADTAPRGAQTWEVPLHTPDILAAAHLITAFTLGWELSGEPRMLEAARYWAWTGVPFVYLTPPAEGLPVGLYATIAVYGATNWEAPVWMGMPVQWCGLVYADALYRLARQDANGPWRRIADGIVASGTQQTWPLPGEPGFNAARQGLLPDSFSLRAQIRNDVAINPATLQVPAARHYGHPVQEDVPLTPAGTRVYAPGTVEVEGPDRFTVRGWPSDAYWVLVSGLPAAPKTVMVNDQPAESPYRDGVLLLHLSGTARVVLTR